MILRQLSLIAFAALSCGPLDAHEQQPDPGETGSSSAALAVTGQIDGVSDTATGAEVRGWACQTGVNASIKVHLYAGASAFSGGTYVTWATADQPSEPSISAACGTAGKPHRFVIEVSRDKLTPNLGRTVFVHGIRTAGTATTNSALNRSGVFRLPARVPYLLSEKVPSSAGPRFQLLIPSGERVTIDKSVDIGIINVGGALVCPTTGSFVISSQGILVEGPNSVFECGSSAAARFNGKLSVVLKPGAELVSRMHPGHSMGERAFAAMAGGTIRLFGDGRKAGFTRLGAQISAGDRAFTVPSTAGWEVGDLVVVGPSGFDPHEAEERTVTAVRGSLVEVSAPFLYPHFGRTETYSNGTRQWTLDERAEVANLTRNIKIESAGTDADLDAAKLGAHMMTMAGAFAYVDGVELVRMGQMGKLGRYPFHWHLAGPVAGQFIKNSSIRSSYQRCLSIHGTHGALVEGNVCYNHFGHGYFLENGGETKNVIRKNLSMLSKQIPLEKALLISDFCTGKLLPTGVCNPINDQRFAASSGFWISNPDNVVTDNVASGAEGTGFWMSFSQKLVCQGQHCDHPLSMPSGTAVFPARIVQTAFSGNVAHSAKLGMSWDGAADGALTGNPMHPSDRFIVPSVYLPQGRTDTSQPLPRFDNLRVFKNIAGIYVRATTVTFSNLVAADNGLALFFAFNQVVESSAIVALSSNHSTRDLDYLKPRMPARSRFHGIRLYDGPFELRGVHFAGFPSQPLIHNGWNVSPVPFLNVGGVNRWRNAVEQLTFAPEPYQKFQIAPPADLSGDAALTSAILDIDGTLAGLPGKTVVPDHPFNRDPSCVPVSGNSALRCAYRVGTLRFSSTQPAPSTLNNMVLTLTRAGPDGSVSTSGDGRIQLNKTNLILGASSAYTYELAFPAGFAPNPLRLLYTADDHGAVSPVVKLAGLHPSCSFAQAMPVSTLAALRAMGTAGFSGHTAAWFADSSGVYMRFNPSNRSNINTSLHAPFATNGGISFPCPGAPVGGSGQALDLEPDPPEPEP